MAKKKLVVSAEVIRAKRLRPCHQHKAVRQIEQGDIVLSVQDKMRKKGYCLPCAREMLNAAEETIRSLRADLNRLEQEQEDG